jgi:hypothetical protein
MTVTIVEGALILPLFTSRHSLTSERQYGACFAITFP